MCANATSRHTVTRTRSHAAPASTGRQPTGVSIRVRDEAVGRPVLTPRQVDDLDGVVRAPQEGVEHRDWVLVSGLSADRISGFIVCAAGQFGVFDRYPSLWATIPINGHPIRVLLGS